MLVVSRLLMVGLLSVGITAATTAQAGNQLFTGSWTVKAFGNEKTGGTGFSEFYSASGIPQGVQCNAYWPRCPFQSTPYVYTTMGGMTGTAKTFNPLGGFNPTAPSGPVNCAPWSNWQGSGTSMRPAKGGTAFTSMGVRPIPPLYRNPRFFTTSTPSAQPNITFCNGTSTASGGFPAKTTGLPYNGKGIIQLGEPITGTWSATTSSGDFSFSAAPANGGGIRVGQGDRTVLDQGQGTARSGAVGEIQAFYPYVYSYTYATLRNNYGVFGAGQGAGDFTATYGGGEASIMIKQGANRFGGIMRMLGAITTKVCYFRDGGCSRGSGQNWQYDAIGASANLTTTGTGTGSSTMILSGLETFTSSIYYHTALMQKSIINLEGERFPWTTGTVTLTATGRGPHKTVHYTHGYDNRTPTSGKGTIQLVTPVLTRWLQPCCNWETGGVGILRIEFIPEPHTWMMLVAGAALLGVGHRMRRR